jgi:hypothetical protein
MSEAGVFSAKMLSDAARLLASSVTELVPVEAQQHLLTAQRELLLAIAVIIEHNAGRTPRNPRASGTTRKPATRRPKRVELD